MKKRTKEEEREREREREREIERERERERERGPWDLPTRKVRQILSDLNELY